jgi:hypothetical protein
MGKPRGRKDVARDAAAILGALGGRVVTERKRQHLRSIAKKGAAARWAKRKKGGRT